MRREQHDRASASRTFHFSAVLLLALAALVAGCPSTSGTPCDSDDQCPAGRCRFGACGPICEEDADCGSRQVCLDGKCAAAPECAHDTDCASGFVCSSVGQCACTSDAACALNQSCVSGKCETRSRCTSDASCPSNQRCEVSQGLCMPPCTFATDCAPGVDPNVATALYTCQQGTCFRHCLNDATCGTGLICADGLCAAAQCQTMSDCAPGQYCTSATFGRCASFQTCTSTPQCGANFECRAFDAMSCPPGFPCAQAICQELPRCLADQDCQGAYCEDHHCQPTRACTDKAQCQSGEDCVGGLCVPGACRGHADCAAGQACVAGACRSAPSPGDIAQLSLTPKVVNLEVGTSAQLHLIGYELDGSSFPLQSASWSVVDPGGNPSTALTVGASGKITGVSEGAVRVRAQVQGAAVNPVEASVQVHDRVASGRRVIVIDAATHRALAGVTVRGCDAPTSAGACADPVEVLTDAAGEARFPSFASPLASFSVASEELRADGLSRYERLSVLDTAATDLLLPLEDNPVQSAAGFNGVISFNQVHSDGNYWLGFTVMSAGDPAEVDLQHLLGEPFRVSLPGVPQKVPVPGSLVLYTSPGLGIPNEVKGRTLGLAQPGRRTATAFAGRTTLDQLTSVRSADFLAWAGAFDYAVVPFNAVNARPLVPDTTDIDNDGLCTDPQQCPQGPEQVPDYFHFAPLTLNPSSVQSLRTEVVLPELPAEFDTAVVATVSLDDEAGLTPLGFTSRTAGAPSPGGGRPLQPVVMRSGAPYAGVEAGRPGVWLMGVQAASIVNGGGSIGGRLISGATLPTRAVLAPVLPSASQSSWSPLTRTFAPGQPQWNAVVSAGGELARVDVVGSQNRHRIYFATQGSQTEVPVPIGPAVGGVDPLGEPNTHLGVTVIDLRVGVTPTDALDLPGASLETPAGMIDAYSRWQGQ